MWLGWACRRAAPIGAIVVSGIIILSLLLQWGILCTNFQALKFINNICLNYIESEVVGNLCDSLCVEVSVEALSCHPTNKRDGVIFSVLWKGKRILYKTPKKTMLLEFELLHWMDENENKKYPNEEEFLSMIKKLVLNRTNLTVSDDDIKKLSTLPGEEDMKITTKRTTVMDTIWLLLQDDDYLNTALFESSRIFPKHIGTCGPLYAVEYTELAKGSSALFSLEDSDEEWERRTQIAISIFDLLEKVDRAKLQLCDVQLKNFGVLEGKMRYLSPGSVRLRGNKPEHRMCKTDHDCGYLDCKARCNTTKARCEQSIESDNLQIVCEKIYLGWTAAGRVILPGLLVSTKASSVLAALLRQCASSNSVPHKSSFRQALYNTLSRKN